MNDMANGPPPHAKVIVDKVFKVFMTQTHQVTALQNVSLSSKEGEFTCIVGPSGCGKTTLLNLIAGLEFPDSGTILIDGKPVTGPGNDRMMLFQESALFPWLNVIDNVLFGLRLKPHLSAKERKEIAIFYLQLVGLERFMQANVHELSGGMKQRVALARALAPNPQVLLMDEPFAALDAMTREQLYFDIQKIWQDQGKTIIFITHNVAEAVCLGDRVLLFTAYPGQIKQEFAIDLDRPRDIRDLKIAKYTAEVTHVLREYMKSHQEPK